MTQRRGNKSLLILAVIIVALAVLVMALLIFSGGISFSNSPISQKSVVNDASIYASTNQTAVQNFIDNIDVNIDPILKTTSKFTILANLVLFDSNKKEYPETLSTNIDLEKFELTDSQGRKLDLGSIQITFDAIGTLQNKNLEISATVLFCLDNDCNTKKLYRQGTLQNNKIALYVGDSFIEPPIGQRKFDYTFTFADEGMTWADQSQHSFQIILKDITFRNFASTEKWLFVGEDEIYNLTMTVNQQKVTILNGDGEAISIFKQDNIFSSCSGGAKAVHINLNDIASGGTSSPALIPEIIFKVNSEPFGSIQSHNDGGQLPDVPAGLHSGGYQGSDTCKTLNLPRNAEIIATIDGTDYKFFTPKAQQNFYVKCSNDLVGIGNVYYGGSYRPSSYEPKYTCSSNIGYSK